MHLLLYLALFGGCTWYPNTAAYREQYAYLDKQPAAKEMRPSDQFVVLLVDAKHLDYSSEQALFQTLTKHPDDASKEGDVGHAWVYLQGYIDGEHLTLEGGHSGEIDYSQPKYFDSVYDAAMAGDPNPAKHLHTVRTDGFFQQGNGGHWPTTAVKLDLQGEEVEALYALLTQKYDFSTYSLQDSQCCSLVAAIGAEIGLDLAYQKHFNLRGRVRIGGDSYQMWEDPEYSKLTIGTPDALEPSLLQLLHDDIGEDAMGWYAETHEPMDLGLQLEHLPERLWRWRLFR